MKQASEFIEQLLYIYIYYLMPHLFYNLTKDEGANKIIKNINVQYMDRTINSS